MKKKKKPRTTVHAEAAGVRRSVPSVKLMHEHELSFKRQVSISKSEVKEMRLNNKKEKTYQTLLLHHLRRVKDKSKH